MPWALGETDARAEDESPKMLGELREKHDDAATSFRNDGAVLGLASP